MKIFVFSTRTVNFGLTQAHKYVVSSRGEIAQLWQFLQFNTNGLSVEVFLPHADAHKCDSHTFRARHMTSWEIIRNAKYFGTFPHVNSRLLSNLIRSFLLLLCFFVHSRFIYHFYFLYIHVWSTTSIIFSFPN